MIPHPMYSEIRTNHNSPPNLKILYVISLFIDIQVTAEGLGVDGRVLNDV